jgi:hypothetical protein
MKLSSLIVGVLSALAFTGTPAGSQTFENGPYYPTPSWDQKIPGAQRFIVLLNWNKEAVLDRETGLVWQRTPASKIGPSWVGVLQDCHIATSTGDRLGWRLPSLEELASLVDRTQSNPALPAGHPFKNVTNAGYCTATTDETVSNLAYAVQLSDGQIFSVDKEQPCQFWCVRRGSSVANPPY